MKSKLTSIIFPVAMGVLGLLLFFGIYGIEIVNPQNFAWCLDKNHDTSQHFLGAWAFLRDKWRFPLGLFYGVSVPDPASISLVDGVPLIAFSVKLLRGPQSSPFQYLGAWSAICFFLQGFFSALLMRRLTSKSFFQLAGVFFLLVSVPFLNIGPASAGLTSHFLIIWAVWLMLGWWRRAAAVQWFFLIIISLMIHPYFSGMCGAIYIGKTLQTLYIYRKKHFVSIVLSWLSVFVGSLSIVYLLGIFKIKTSCSVGLFGQYQINLNCLVNPQSWDVSALVAPMPFQMGADTLYLGVGGFVVWVYYLPTIIKLLKRSSSLWRHYGVITVILIAMLMFAVNCRVYLGKDLLMHFIYPSFLKDFFGIFRAAGRFAWPVWYLVFALAVAAISKEKNYVLKLTVITVAVLLQIYDLGNGIIKNTWARNVALQEKKLNYPCLKLENKLSGKEKVCYTYNVETFALPVYFALKNNMVVEDFYFPRNISRSIEINCMMRLLDGKNIDNKSVYFLSEAEVQKVRKLYPDLFDKIYSADTRRYLLIP